MISTVRASIRYFLLLRNVLPAIRKEQKRAQSEHAIRLKGFTEINQTTRVLRQRCLWPTPQSARRTWPYRQPNVQLSFVPVPRTHTTDLATKRPSHSFKRS